MFERIGPTHRFRTRRQWVSDYWVRHESVHDFQITLLQTTMEVSDSRVSIRTIILNVFSYKIHMRETNKPQPPQIQGPTGI
jgi:hypothetical protein